MEENNKSDDNAPTQDTETEVEVVSKQMFRQKVWEHLEKNKISDYPRPVYGRIPNFKENPTAADKILELEEFKSAINIEVNPDKPQEHARAIVLEQGKELYVPIPRLKNGFLKHISVKKDEDVKDFKEIVNRKGLEHHGEEIDVKASLKIDLIIVGSVAVSRSGHRIGKGRGYADLEFAILSEMKAVDENTVIITNVHDSQVFDSLPSDIFQAYDVPVDIIVTPTEIIRIQNRLPRPSGIFWDLISNRKVKMISALQSLKEIHESEGKVVTLKEVDTDIESYDSRKPRFKRRFRRRVHRNPSSKSTNSKEESLPVRPQRIFRKRRITSNEEPTTENGENAENKKNKKYRKPYRKSRQHIDFSLMISNIQRNVRVRDLKTALNKEGVKPNEIEWKGYKGVCFLHYAKPKPKPETETETKPPVAVDNVIQILQNLKLNPEAEEEQQQLEVKVMEPISRIETTNITAV